MQYIMFHMMIVCFFFTSDINTAQTSLCFPMICKFFHLLYFIRSNSLIFPATGRFFIPFLFCLSLLVYLSSRFPAGFGCMCTCVGGCAVGCCSAAPLQKEEEGLRWWVIFSTLSAPSVITQYCCTVKRENTNSENVIAQFAKHVQWNYNSRY